MTSRKNSPRKFRVTPFGKMKWKVTENKPSGKNVQQGYIVKVQALKPAKVWVFQSFTLNHKYIGQAFTLKGAMKKFESRIK